MRIELSKYALHQELVRSTFAGAARIFDREMLELIAKNNQLQKSQAQGFFQQGHFYGSPLQGTIAPTLHRDLWKEFYTLSDRGEVSRLPEYVPISHFFTRTIAATLSDYELRILYPPGLHGVLDEYQKLLSPERVQSDAWLETQLRVNADTLELIGQKLCLNLLIGN